MKHLKQQFKGNKAAVAFLESIEAGCPFLYLTGSAGTGKSTLIKGLPKDKFLRLATTSAAATHIQGYTVHSTLRVPFHPLANEPLKTSSRQAKKIKAVIQKYDYLIIDEISMCRVDVFAFIDKQLAAVLGNKKPFGGGKIILVGDALQLPPVVRREEAQFLKAAGYPHPYFFAYPQFKLFKQFNLTQIYRQNPKDKIFITALQYLREGKVTPKLIAYFNQDATPPAENKSIIVACHRKEVARINQQALAKLPGELMEFDAVIEGEFRAADYPTAKCLGLKIGTQVIFVRNGSHWYNGQKAEVVGFEEDAIEVESNGETFSVGLETWKHTRLVPNKDKTKKPVEEVLGSFQQFPLNLGYAITVHKSQGMTFEAMTFHKGKGTFAEGQLYVALSRAKSKKGLFLNQPLTLQDAQTSQVALQHLMKGQLQLATEVPANLTPKIVPTTLQCPHCSHKFQVSLDAAVPKPIQKRVVLPKASQPLQTSNN